MPWIRTVPWSEASGTLKEAYDWQARRLGEPTEYTQLGSLYPDLVQLRLQLYKTVDLPTYVAALTEREGLMLRWMTFFQQWPLVILPTLCDLPPKQRSDITVEGQKDVLQSMRSALRARVLGVTSTGDIPGTYRADIAIGRADSKGLNVFTFTVGDATRDLTFFIQ